MDYYKVRSGIDRLRTAFALVGLLLAGGYAVYVLASLPTRGGGNHVSTGPVTAAHASFENDCQTCHLDFTPIDPHAPSDWLPLLGVDAKASIEHLETACQQCHAVGSHHRSRMRASFAAVDQNCVHCHHEHQGRDHDLAEIDRQRCVSCHEDLASVVNDQPKRRERVVGFNQNDHGDFQSLLADDPGSIRFSHHQHLLPGQVSPDDRGGTALSQLTPADRDRYRQNGQTDSDLVRLQCDSCHTLSGQDKTVDESDSRSIDVTRLGRTMNPVQFDLHCAACHAISANSASGEVLPLPHAVPWSVITPLLAASINGDRMLGIAAHPQDTTRAKPQLGTGIGTPSSGDWRVSDEELAAARLRVESQCRDCHDDQSVTDEGILASRTGTTSPMIPRRWLRSGYYDHSAHRQIACQYCHAAAFPELAEAAERNFDFNDANRVMIAGIESCEGCHRSAGTPLPDSIASANKTWWRGMPNWASDQCTTCHRYHSQPQAAPASEESP